ncbi:hypothetical protein ACFPIJ_34470 [Dactylosporangium cerinum]|uniref:Uncharacterized protein n=1 Tax=Dactylosporangium cerinum TaxID=1434730 RepID=A0ABV9W2N1_9ACTN
MRYVVAEQFDARAYLAALPQLAGDLPPGAARFATDPDHYDLAGLRCVKDLSIGELEHDEPGTARIRFTGNPWKHDEDLVVQYTGVIHLHVEPGEPTSVSGPGPIGSIMLDEILPDPGGCRHEIAGHNGRAVVVCADLTATWHRVPRPDDPPPGTWTPVLPLGDRWNWLGRHTDGTWVVGVPHRHADPAPERMDALSHVLTQPWRTVAHQWPAVPSLDDIVTHALTCTGWESLSALDWIEHGYPLGPHVRAALETMRQDRRQAQERRARASKLLRRAAEGEDVHHGR